MPEVTKTFRDIDGFRAAVNNAVKELPESVVSQIQRKVLLGSLSSIVKRTPVDTGTARGNWQVSEGSPASTALDVQDKTGAATIAVGFDAIGELPTYCRAFITNNLPYIEVLEFGGFPPPKLGPFRGVKARARKPLVTPSGFSIKAPRGMVGITFEEQKLSLASVIAGLA